ncbi:nickel-dependent hydrogenase large subunit [Rhodopila sp.]|jgi:Ni,Fe-hydrogenase III large subunit|uniref:NADH-quinone oxidoreductase subunit D-related protein n=1 Tax=Rhodopila sp. TaxID=2480087 RepID=UPI002BE9353C|nr:nickel-dependent hydrogenase large subunit [Rhodopila sp.]HVZ07357.1 nickel-dependent hydrogenase large subunit [Rhodopila sp.]
MPDVVMDAIEIVPCRPWPRHVLAPETWAAFISEVPAAGLVLTALWADTQQVHALFLAPAALTASTLTAPTLASPTLASPTLPSAIPPSARASTSPTSADGALAAPPAIAISTAVEHGHYPALSPVLPVAAPYERMLADLWGHVAEGAVDPRPWLDHGQWTHMHPMAPRPIPTPPASEFDGLLETEEPLMQLGLGPIHGRITEAARLMLLVRDGTVAVADPMLGFCHKGTLTLMRGKSPRNAARFAARLSGDATVAHALAFARAAEAAQQAEPPPRARALRGAMLELERVAGHLDTLGEVARLAETQAVWTRCGLLRERLLRASQRAFGHRLMMDCVVPGGVALDIDPSGAEVILRALGEIANDLPLLRRLHDGTTLAGRLNGLARADLALMRACGTSGPVARACGASFDARLLDRAGTFGTVTAPPDGSGDALCRQRLRIEEISVSLGLIAAALQALPEGPLTVALPHDSGEGFGCAESLRGDVWHWVRLDHGQIAACFARDPGWALWPAAQALLLNTGVEDVDLIRASLALPASGMDL